MKKKISLSIYIVLFISTFIFNQSCSEYNEAVPLEFAEHKPKVGSPEYYEALRSYKKSDHAICFGWWGQSGTAEIGSNMATRFEGLPDSMDIVSMWGGVPQVGSPAWNEMQVVRKKKGTKFVMCLFGSGVSRMMKQNNPELVPDDKSKWIKENVFKAIDLVAKAMSDSLDKYQLDGFDLDYEPGEAAERDEVFGNDGLGTINGGKESVQYLFKALSKYMGPKSNTDRVLLIDGYYELGILDYINFYVQQAYNSTSFQALENRLNTYGKGEVPPEKFVVTENMQQFGPKGTIFNLNGQNIGSVLGMAMWNSTKGRKGGFGAYIIEQDALSNPSQGLYYHLRRGIQIQNPAPY